MGYIPFVIPKHDLNNLQHHRTSRRSQSTLNNLFATQYHPSTTPPRSGLPPAKSPPLTPTKTRSKLFTTSFHHLPPIARNPRRAQILCNAHATGMVGCSARQCQLNHHRFVNESHIFCPQQPEKKLSIVNVWPLHCAEGIVVS